MLRSPSPDANIKELLRCRAGYHYQQSPSVYSQSHSVLDDLAVSMLELDDEQDIYDSDEDQDETRFANIDLYPLFCSLFF